jgi:Bardet-Biedl syndrome 1 protein
MPADIVDVCSMRAKNTQCILVALKNGDIRMYNDKHHIDTLNVREPINGLIFGVFGREEGCLLINTISGSIQTKIL